MCIKFYYIFNEMKPTVEHLIPPIKATLIIVRLEIVMVFITIIIHRLKHNGDNHKRYHIPGINMLVRLNTPACFIHNTFSFITRSS